MKIKQLISRLKKLDQNLNIYIVDIIEGNDYELENITTYEGEEDEKGNKYIFLEFK